MALFGSRGYAPESGSSGAIWTEGDVAGSNPGGGGGPSEWDLLTRCRLRSGSDPREGPGVDKVKVIECG